MTDGDEQTIKRAKEDGQEENGQEEEEKVENGNGHTVEVGCINTVVCRQAIDY